MVSVSRSCDLTYYYIVYSFVSLLERAEEEFGCQYVLVFFPKSLPKPLLADRVKSYRFFGFELLPPTNPLIPASCDKQYLFMAYKLDD